MKTTKLNSLSKRMDSLRRKGFTEDFISEENCIRALYCKKEYQPEDLLIVESHRFEDLDRNDTSEIIAIVSVDGIKGTIVISYNIGHSQNIDLIREIEEIKIS